MRGEATDWQIQQLLFNLKVSSNKSIDSWCHLFYSEINLDGKFFVQVGILSH